MTGKIQKFLAKLNAKELEQISSAVENIEHGHLDGLNIKPIRGKKGFYRVRVGRTRIIYRFTEKDNEIIHITNRDDQTYRDF